MSLMTLSLAKDWMDAEAAGGPIPADLILEVESLRVESPHDHMQFLIDRDFLRGHPGMTRLAHDVRRTAPADVPAVWLRLIVIAACCSALWMLWHWLATGERVG